MLLVPRPFVAYLRVYEPLSAFPAELAGRLRTVVESAPLDRAAVGVRERELWLRSQAAALPRLLPGERPDGSPLPNYPLDALLLRSADVPDASELAEEELICPLDMRARSAAALAGFLAEADPPLWAATVDGEAEVVRARTTAALGDVSGAAMHSLCSTWTVPLPWFALVDHEERYVVPGGDGGLEREVSWRVSLATALRRLVRAHKTVSESIGDEGPAQILAETRGWLEHFQPGSAVELDYGGLVQLLDDDMLLSDTSAADVHAIVDAMERDDTDEIARRYESLREFWGKLAAVEHQN
jgi:hypothetical protein